MRHNGNEENNVDPGSAIPGLYVQCIMHFPLSALDRKTLRDLWHMKGQAVAIALVIGCGVALFTLSKSMIYSLELTQTTYYERFNFAEVFASLKRAPDALAERIAEIPGVARFETRIVIGVNLSIPGLTEPATGRLISVPDTREPLLNQIYLRRGSWLTPAERRPGDRERGLRRRQSSGGRRLHLRGDQRPTKATADCRRGALAGVHLRNQAGRYAARQRALWRVLDESRGAFDGVQPGGSVQRRGLLADARGQYRRGDLPH